MPKLRREPPRLFFTVLVLSILISIGLFMSFQIVTETSPGYHIIEERVDEPRTESLIVPEDPGDKVSSWQIFILSIMELAAPWAPVLVPVVYYFFGKPKEKST